MPGGILEHYVDVKFYVESENGIQNCQIATIPDISAKNGFSLIRRELSRFGRYRWDFWILRKILHRHSAPGFHQASSHAKVMTVCMRFALFLQIMNGKKVSEAPFEQIFSMMRSRICVRFFLKL